MDAVTSHAATVRALALRAFVALIVVNAIIAIAAILGLGTDDDTEWRVFGTTSVITVVSLVVAANAAALAQRRLGPLPWVSTATSVVAAVMTIVAIWGGDPGEGWAKFVGIVATVGLTTAVMSLVSLPSLAAPWNRAQWLAHGSAFVIGAMTVVAILTEDASIQAYAVMSVLLAAAMLLILVGSRVAASDGHDMSGIEFCPLCGTPKPDLRADTSAVCGSCGAVFRVTVVDPAG